jgi:4-hydroxy-tetrahydrodipicolinate reductase
VTHDDADRLVSVVIVGARGRMGQALIKEVLDSENLALAGAVARRGAPGLGEDAGKVLGMVEAGVDISDRIAPRRGSVVVDFSLPEATNANIAACRRHGVPLVLGTTGLSADSRSALADAAREIPIVVAANFSVGVTVLTRLAAIAARSLGTAWETEIMEVHHRHKRDAPSGTALRIGEAVAAATGRTLEESAVLGRAGKEGPRGRDEIGLVALRGGDVAGEHTVMFFGASERLELVHRASDRAIFARGALRAAAWVADRERGLYDMADVLGLSNLV